MERLAVAGNGRMIPFPGPRWVLDPERIRAVDRAAIDAGLPGAALMESAGRGVAETILEEWPAGGRVVVLAGSGNNAGDGLVAARVLERSGWAVELVLFRDPDELEGDAALQWRLVEPLALPVHRVGEPSAAADLVRRAAGARCVIDALLGTGVSGQVREPIRTAIETLAEIDAPVVAVDAPSGLDCATGRVLGAAVRATVTVTFGFLKPGLLLADGPGRSGRIVLVPLGYPRHALEAAGERPVEWIGLPDATAALPERSHRAHKGTAGRLLVVAGSERFTGAAVLTATAALRSGVGMLVVATPEAVVPHLLEVLPEAIVEPLPPGKEGGLDPGAAERVTRAASEADAVAIGPGLGAGEGVREIVEAALAAPGPVVVDADGLNVLATDPTPVERRSAPTLLTPHPGELGRWLGREARAVDSDRLAAAGEAAERWAAHVALKGSPTVVASPGGGLAINLTGNPGLATGGSGDVLTGIVGSLLAQGVDARQALRAAVVLHGLAADWAAHDRGERGMAPSDLFTYVPLTIRELMAGRGRALLERIEHPRAELLGVGAGEAPDDPASPGTSGAD